MLCGFYLGRYCYTLHYFLLHSCLSLLFYLCAGLLVTCYILIWALFYCRVSNFANVSLCLLASNWWYFKVLYLFGKMWHFKVTFKMNTITHTWEESYHCGQCEKSFSQTVYMKKWMRSQTGEKPYPCKQFLKKLFRISESTHKYPY